MYTRVTPKDATRGNQKSVIQVIGLQHAAVLPLQLPRLMIRVSLVSEDHVWDSLGGGACSVSFHVFIQYNFLCEKKKGST